MEIYAYPVEYLVTAWPQGQESEGTRSWAVHVVYLGKSRWAVSRGWRPEEFLDATGTWRWRSEAVPEEYCFSLDEALGLAREALPKVNVMGLTVADALERNLLWLPCTLR